MNNITLEKIVRFIIYAGLAVLLYWVMVRFAVILVYLLIGLILSYILNPIVSRMQANGMNRTLSGVLTVFAMLIFIIWLSTTLLPNIGNQLARLGQEFNAETVLLIASAIEEYSLQLVPYLPEGYLIDNIDSKLSNFFNVSAENIQTLIGNILGVFTNLLTAFIIIPFSCFFFLKDGSKLRRKGLELVPNKYFETTVNIINKIETRLVRHFRAVALQSTLVAVLSWIFLSIAGLDNALAVGVAIGVANSIPYFGPFIGYMLSVTIGIVETGDFSRVPAAIAAVAVVQLIDNVIFYPAIFSKSAQMHPLFVLITILTGAELAGILGMLVAIPTATVLQVIIKEINWSINNYYVFKKSRI
ncbi:MAG: AI-2E family transporter [Cyclonatronaceae bacterium]